MSKRKLLKQKKQRVFKPPSAFFIRYGEQVENIYYLWKFSINIYIKNVV